jgi:hypothetical protein
MDRLERVLRDAAEELPPELAPYYGAVLGMHEQLRRQAARNLRDLELGLESILPEVLSNTLGVTSNFGVYNRMFVRPVLRSKPSDRLCLKLLRWMHSVHPATSGIPVALSDEEFSVAAVRPTIYFMPCSAQYGLLYLPLFFHEVGHLLYFLREDEMDDLVRDLQNQIRRLLTPSVQRDDQRARQDETTRRLIVETWYEWTQELFCDAVGYTMCGTAFAHAFSMYMRMRGPSEYHVPPEDLAGRSHPVTWLRVRLLADRVRLMGYHDDAQLLEEAWEEIAISMGVVEDYYGFYDESFLGSIRATLDDMLVEASPRHFQGHEVEVSASLAPASPVHLLNLAWSKFEEEPDGYQEWEESSVADFLERDIPS